MKILHYLAIFEKNYCLRVKLALILCTIFINLTPLAYASEMIMHMPKLANSNQMIADASEYIRQNQNNMRLRHNNIYSYGDGSIDTQGSIDVYTDPQTGDRVTRVIAPKYNNTQQQNPPIIVYPTIDPNSFIPGQNIKPTPWPPNSPNQPINPRIVKP